VRKGLDEAKDAFSELENSFNALDDGIAKIHELERGTLEWKNAITDSNIATMELL